MSADKWSPAAVRLSSCCHCLSALQTLWSLWRWFLHLLHMHVFLHSVRMTYWLRLMTDNRNALHFASFHCIAFIFGKKKRNAIVRKLLFVGKYLCPRKFIEILVSLFKGFLFYFILLFCIAFIFYKKQGRKNM